MKKKIAVIVLGVMLCLALLPMSVFADVTPVDYLDAEGNKQSCETYQVLTGEYTELSLEGPNWYVVKDTATVSSRIEVSGDVHLILTDGSTLTSVGGIHVKADNSLSIYGQSWNLMGSLDISKYDWTSAGIGGNVLEKAGKITINGGNIAIDGAGHPNNSNTGIGVGRNGSSGEIEINGGNIDIRNTQNPLSRGKSGSIVVTPPTGYVYLAQTDETTKISGSPFTEQVDIAERIINCRNLKLWMTPEQSYSITVDDDGYGTAIANPTSAVAGDIVELSATANKYYCFDQWQSEDVVVNEKNLFVMPAKEVTVKATFAHEPAIPYLDENGISQDCKEYIKLTPDMTEWSEKWVVVDGNVTISDRVQVKGDIHLILLDGCKLEAKKGIHVPKENSLTIYGQSIGENAGALSSVGENYNAGIGGDIKSGSGQVTINGGIITASAGDASGVNQSAAAIGGGANGGDGHVTIHGGNITAIANGKGAGIGGGYAADLPSTGTAPSCGYVTITGGTIYAEASECASAIGGGEGNIADAVVSITGGNITASGRSEASAIGGAKAFITIRGGKIDLTTEKTKAISCGNDGWVMADPGAGYAIEVKYSEKNEVAGSPFQSGYIQDSLGNYRELHLRKGPFYTIELRQEGDGEVSVRSANPSGAISGNSVSIMALADSHWTFKEWKSEQVTVDKKYYTKFVMPDENVVLTAIFAQNPVSYLDENGKNQTCTKYTNVTNSVTEWKDGWYVVWDAQQIPNRINISGETNLILTDECSMTALEGIHLKEGSKLTIYSQSTGEKEGILTATTDDGRAGIGGDLYESRVEITINGGDITASSKYGAGIGGGSASVTPAKITINRGTVTGESTSGGAGIGGGSNGQGDVTINDGTVTGKSAKGGAGIGGGVNNSGTVRINGGIVKGIGGADSAGIGGGRRGNGFVTITRGTIDAVSQNASGILAGNNGNVTVSPKKGVSLHVETEAGEIAGSPFGTEEAIEAKLSGSREAHIFEENGSGGVTPKPEVPGTGDTNMPWLWTVLLAVCVAVIIGIVIYSRKKKNK